MSDDHQADPQIPPIPSEAQRKIERFLIARRLTPKPMAAHFGGRVRVDHMGRAYVTVNGGLRRVILREGGTVQPITKWSKARKRQEKRLRRRTS